MLKFVVTLKGLGVAVAEALPSVTAGSGTAEPFPVVRGSRQSTPNLNACLPCSNSACPPNYKVGFRHTPGPSRYSKSRRRC